MRPCGWIQTIAAFHGVVKARYGGERQRGLPTGVGRLRNYWRRNRGRSARLPNLPRLIDEIKRPIDKDNVANRTRCIGSKYARRPLHAIGGSAQQDGTALIRALVAEPPDHERAIGIGGGIIVAAILL